MLDHLVGDGFDVQGLPTTELASGHGTHVAGIIAGNGFYTRDGDVDAARYGGDGYVFGVAPQAELVSIKNGDTIWAGLSSFGLEWLIEHGAENGVRVVNNSWGCLGGCAFNGTLRHRAADPRPLQRGHRRRVRGRQRRGRRGRRRRSPATRRARTRIGVANYDHANHQLAASSSRGQKASTQTLADPATWTPESEPANGLRRPDVGRARREHLGRAHADRRRRLRHPARRTSTTRSAAAAAASSRTRTMSGTSMATPHVVGAVAVLFSACPSATPLDVMRASWPAPSATASTRPGSATAVAEPFEAGYGGLDVRAQPELAAGRSPPCLMIGGSERRVAVRVARCAASTLATLALAVLLATATVAEADSYDIVPVLRRLARRVAPQDRRPRPPAAVAEPRLRRRASTAKGSAVATALRVRPRRHARVRRATPASSRSSPASRAAASPSASGSLANGITGRYKPLQLRRVVLAAGDRVDPGRRPLPHPGQDRVAEAPRARDEAAPRTRRSARRRGRAGARASTRLERFLHEFLRGAAYTRPRLPCAPVSSLVALLVLVPVAMFGRSRGPTSRAREVPEGVRVAGIDVGGLTAGPGDPALV